MGNKISQLPTDIVEIPSEKKTESTLHWTHTPQILFNCKTSQKL